MRRNALKSENQSPHPDSSYNQAMTHQQIQEISITDTETLTYTTNKSVQIIQLI